MTSTQMIFIPLFLISGFFFLWSCQQRFKLVLLGESDDRTDQFSARLAGMFRYAFFQKRVVQRPYGLNHFLLFWSFLVLMLANGEFLLHGLFPALHYGKLPAPLFHGLLLAFDLVSVLVLLCVVLAFTRRLFFPPDYLDGAYSTARSGEAFLILGMITLLMVAFFGMNGAELTLGELPKEWMPISGAVGAMMSGWSESTLNATSGFFWWLHALVLLAFMNFLPRSKHMHILTAIPNCFFRSLETPVLPSREIFEEGSRYGAQQVDQLSWKDLFDSYSCTECGRCQDVCPAHNTGKPLNPRQVVHDVKVNLLRNGERLDAGKSVEQPLIGDTGEGSVSEEALWACTTCGACLNVCPVLIEHPGKMLKMRRHLVQMEARFPEELLNLFENMEQRSNPWGIAPSERTKWCTQLDAKPFVAGETEYLFFVGCAGAFDTRNKHVTVALSMIMDAAGVSWGILGKDELCCGDSLRRLGNEYIFDQLAQKNVDLFKEKGVTKIVTQCPHCFTTLKNDYRQYGLEVEVLHHSELVADLIKNGRLVLKNKVQEKILFHDSCYLGRHNDTYTAPREVLQAANGTAPAEFERHGSDSFCCGAGGGRMWMEEDAGSRINQARVKEALESAPETICVSCPYCMTMIEDGLKDEAATSVRVKDIAEVVAEQL
ncbi:MAG: electron transfer flavoprotein [Desulfuromonas sp.]|nr:MAG: electron transfer flavoprotein [Desulfuromonas sp.]